MLCGTANKQNKQIKKASAVLHMSVIMSQDHLIQVEGEREKLLTNPLKHCLAWSGYSEASRGSRNQTLWAAAGLEQVDGRSLQKASAHVWQPVLRICSWDRCWFSRQGKVRTSWGSQGPLHLSATTSNHDDLQKVGAAPSLLSSNSTQEKTGGQERGTTNIDLFYR